MSHLVKAIGQPKTCSMADCRSAIVARGLCNKHYLQESSAGRIKLYARERREASISADELRTLLLADSRNIKTSLGCIVWNGSRDRHQYGQVRYRDRLLYVTRVILGIHDGPSNIHACHRCDNPPCINPEHLFIGTQKDNSADMMRKGRGGGQFKKLGKTHCPSGHQYSIVSGRMRCRECSRIYQSNRKANARSKG